MGDRGPAVTLVFQEYALLSKKILLWPGLDTISDVRILPN